MTGQQLKEQGISDVQAADTAPHRGHRQQIETVALALAKGGVDFTAEDVRRVLVLAGVGEPHSPNLLPSVFGSLASQRLIEPAGWTRATRRSRHAATLRVWRGPSTDAA
ncbi:hypothetical protein DT076_16825 [Desertihabitans brevis]|uniref:Uncharacterized protein n=1 Tax=Desertihabitans brevis TaxID=2268447 RepID=A0A367YR88_9ACTN|nr:hypothetical protein [Desertihabitans brevis]RCK68310.1 hypothetical protein DT076_16825 [Desertihabitans brevis]